MFKKVETQDASAPWIMVVSIVMAVSAIVMHVALYRMFQGLKNGQGASIHRPNPAPAPDDYEKIFDEQSRILNSYQWVDRGAGVARIPIERAMEILSHGR